MMHEGWYNAANKLIAFLNDYIKTAELNNKKVKLWISGFTRVTFRDINELDLYDKDHDRRKVIGITGHYFGHSGIDNCDDGYAAGYYSYSDCEGLQIWIPVTNSYHLDFIGYSKKPYHWINAYSFYYRNDNEIVDSDIAYREKRTLWDDYEWWSTDQHANELPAREQA